MEGWTDGWREGKKKKIIDQEMREKKRRKKKKSIASSFPALIQWVISVSMAR